MSPLWWVLAAVMLSLIFGVMAAEWRILSKAGEKGWKSLVPIYNVFLSHKIVGMSHIWFLVELFVWVVETFFGFIVEAPGLIENVWVLFTTVFTTASAIVHMIKLSRCFGKGLGTAIGCMLLPYIFLPIIAFGSARYTKPGEEKLPAGENVAPEEAL